VCDRRREGDPAIGYEVDVCAGAVLLLVVTAAFPRVPCPGLNDAGPQRLELVGAIVASETGDAGATLPFKYITWESHTHCALTLNKPLVRARVCVFASVHTCMYDM